MTDASLRLYLGNPAEPENTSSVLEPRSSSAAGDFGFSFVTRSDYWSGVPAQQASRYIVAMDPPRGLGAGRVLVPDVAVEAGQATPTWARSASVTTLARHPASVTTLPLSRRG